MKYFFTFIIVFIYFRSYLTSEPLLWMSPHKVITETISTLPVSFLSTNLPPDLSKLSRTTYLTFRIYEDSSHYLGLIKVEPQADTPLVTGFVFKNNEPESLSSIEGKIEAAKDRVWLDLNPTPGDNFMATKGVYTKTVTLKKRLSFHRNDNGQIYLQLPFNQKDSILREVLIDSESYLKGSWKSKIGDETWRFNFKHTPKNQVDGLVELESPTENCVYSIIATPSVDKNAWLITGDHSSRTNSACPPRFWNLLPKDGIIKKNPTYDLIGGNEVSPNMQIHR
ncbi:hypothetical protein BDW_06225 [Bdellovibrio bacteriovorus W]|nr:hypothetical protein BDW_06225 [Bdellovibrio bacteriovorus W]